MAHPIAPTCAPSSRATSPTCIQNHGQTFFIANEIEGILFKGRHAEQIYVETGAFDQLSTSGYYHSLPADPLRQFIDAAAEVQRAMGFQNEKDHPEVAPAQFELNYSYVEALIAADQVMLYKLICRQVADRIGMTASFLPKPVTGVNGNGMHTNMSLSEGDTNIFWDRGRRGKALADCLEFRGAHPVERAQDLCLILNPSVNAYRRLDPHFEAPNQIIASPIDRGAMVRMPIGNERSARIEVRSISPDANPYMVLYSLLRTGLEGPVNENIRQREEILPDNIYDAIHSFCSSGLTARILGAGSARSLRRAEAQRGGPLPAPARQLHQAGRDPVPPRDHQPVFVEPVLGTCTTLTQFAMLAAPSPYFGRGLLISGWFPFRCSGGITRRCKPLDRLRTRSPVTARSRP